MLSATGFIFYCYFLCVISICVTRAAQTCLTCWALTQSWRSAVTDWIFWPLTLRSLRSPRTLRSSWRSTCHLRPRSKGAGHTAATAAVIQVFIPQRARVQGRLSSEKWKLKYWERRKGSKSWTKECKTWVSNLRRHENGLSCSQSLASCRDQKKNSRGLVWADLSASLWKVRLHQTLLYEGKDSRWLSIPVEFQQVTGSSGNYSCHAAAHYWWKGRRNRCHQWQKNCIKIPKGECVMWRTELLLLINSEICLSHDVKNRLTFTLTV